MTITNANGATAITTMTVFAFRSVQSSYRIRWSVCIILVIQRILFL
jgi:hypothetical protein